jgi:hypothetical protein
MLRQDLQRHIALQFGVASAVHLAHSALPNRGGDFIRAEPRARGEGQTRLPEG